MFFFPRPNFYQRKIEEENSRNAINKQILDSILDDDNETFIQLVLQNKGDDSNPNKLFVMTNYKMPILLSDHPTYASVCCFFGAEKCFTSLLMICTDGPSSESFKRTDRSKRSPIHFACFGGNMNIIRQLFQLGFDLNETDNEYFQPSHYSAMAGHLDVIQYLFTKGAVDLIHVYRTMPITIACLYGHINIVKFFFGNPDFINNILTLKSVNYKNEKTTFYHLVCERGHVDILDYLLTKKEYAMKQLKILDHMSRTPLNIACQNGNLICVKKLINFEKIDFSRERNKKHVSLIDAAEGGFIDIINFLLKQNNYDINMRNSNRLNALEVAVINGHLNITEILIQNGATKNFNTNDIGKLFLLSCGTYNMEMIKFLDKKFEIPYKTMGDIFIKQACKIESEDLVLFLLEKKCNLNCLHADDFNYRIRWTRFMTFLKNNGLDFSEMKLDSGELIIIHALKEGSLNTVKDLISKGVSLNGNIIDNSDLVQIACHRGNLELFSFLISFKPTIDKCDKLMSILASCMDNYKLYKDYEGIKSCISIAEILLKDYNANPNDQGVLVFMARHLFLNALEVFEKYGADLNNIIFLCPTMISEEYIPLIDFLRERNIDINSICTNNKTPLIIEAFRYCNSSLVDKLLFEGAILTKEMIEKNKLIKIVCANGNYDLFNILLRYKPDINNGTSCLAKIVENLSKSRYSFDNIEKNKLLKIAEILIRDFKADCNDDLIINYASKKCLIEFLELLVKYGADFSNCSLNFHKMVSKKHLEVFHLLEKNGCKFQKHKQVSDIFSWPKWNSPLFEDKDDLNAPPIKIHLKNLLFHQDYDPSTLVFLIKYTSNDVLLSLKTDQIYKMYHGNLSALCKPGNQNLTDILLLFGQYQGILDLFKKLNDVLLPLLVPLTEFKELINECDIQELKDMISAL